MNQEFEANKRIRILREHLGMGRTEFGDKLGINRQNLQNIELEKQKATAWLIEAIAKEWKEYGYWVATGLTIPEAGQISPEIEEIRINLKQA
jgi:hypothetical protein